MNLSIKKKIRTLGIIIKLEETKDKQQHYYNTNLYSMSTQLNKQLEI